MIQTGRDALTRSGHGSAIFISSIYGLLGPDESLYEGTSMVTPAVYSASKSGLLGLMRHLATTLAPEVRVNAITLGGVLRKQPESFREKYEARTPLGRMASEEDIKGAVAYLVSDLSEYVTGQNIIVDGGWTAW
jgi:NAD(P)-dependent dehydrogenase (short-subunit alcohol dehydrogenase family)